jgi:hypothetical protein
LASDEEEKKVCVAMYYSFTFKVLEMNGSVLVPEELLRKRNRGGKRCC